MKTAPLDLEHLGSLITIKGTLNCLGYLLNCGEHGVYDATYGRVPVSGTHATIHNTALTKAMIEGLDTCQIGQGNTFYMEDSLKPVVKTFDGVVVSDQVVKVSATRYSFTRNGRKFMVKANHDGNDVFVKRVG